MSQNRSHHTLLVCAILLIIVACVLPSQTTPPAPSGNSINIETVVAGTAQAASTQTAQANPVLPTAMPAATETFTPTPQVSVSGTSLIVQEDQSTVFIDYRAGIQLVIPPGWMAIRLNEKEYFDAFESEAARQNPEIWDRLSRTRDLDPVYFRLDAIDIRPGHSPDGILSNMNVIFQPGDKRTLEEWEQAERDQYRSYADFKFISAQYPTTSNGTRVLLLEESFSASRDKGTIYYQGVFFNVSTGTVVLDFYTNSAYKDAVLPDFVSVVNSLTSFTP